jgi:hypothetical protein|tara:strand:- start:17 stop:127 length:111 start_codon:yes stop_codon:yes gene_type:complete
MKPQWDSFLVEKKKKRNYFLLGIVVGVLLTYATFYL